MLLSSGINFGYKKTIPHVLGIVIGFSLMIFLMGIGLGIVFKKYPFILDIVKYLGVGYLVYIVYKTLVLNISLDNNNKIKPFSFIQSVLFQWVNPKAWIFSMSVIALYITNLEYITIQLFIIVITYGSIIFITASSWSIAGTILKKYTHNQRFIKIFNLIISILMIVSIFLILIS